MQNKQSENDNPAAAHPKLTTTKRIGQIGLSILNPFSDLMVIYQTGIKPTFGKLGVLREQMVASRSPKECLTFEKAVECSGQSVSQLLASFRRKRMWWWCLMVVSLLAAFILLLGILYTSPGLPTEIILRAALTDTVLTFASLLGLAKVLETNYRLWQLSRQRLSVSEGGTFQNYQADADIWLHAMSASAPY